MLEDTFAKIQVGRSYKSLQVSRLDDYDALVVAELSCLSDAKDDVIAEYAAIGLEFVDDVEDVLLERA